MSWLTPSQKERQLYASLDQGSALFLYTSYLALASRVDSVLLRNIRMRYFAKSSVSLELQFWHCNLIKSKNHQFAIIKPGVARLLANWRKQQLADGFGEVIQAMAKYSQHLPEYMQMEQALRWAVLQADTAALQTGARRILKSIMAASEPQQLELARWLKGVLPSIHTKNSNILEVQWLADYVTATLGANTTQSSHGNRGLPDILQSQTGSATHYLELEVFTDAIKFHPATSANEHTIGIKGALPTSIRFSYQAGGQQVDQWHAVWPDKVVSLRQAPDNLVLQTLTGQRYQIQTEGALLGVTPEAVLLLFMKADYEVAENIRLALQDNGVDCERKLLSDVDWPLRSNKPVLVVWSNEAAYYWQELRPEINAEESCLYITTDDAKPPSQFIGDVVLESKAIEYSPEIGWFIEQLLSRLSGAESEKETVSEQTNELASGQGHEPATTSEMKVNRANSESMSDEEALHRAFDNNERIVSVHFIQGADMGIRINGLWQDTIDGASFTSVSFPATLNEGADEAEELFELFGTEFFECWLRSPPPIMGAPLISRQLLLTQIEQEIRDSERSNIANAPVIKGLVIDIQDETVFLDLGGATGFIAKQDLSWQRIEDRQQLLKVGEYVRAKVLSNSDLDAANFSEPVKFKLGLKQVNPAPWFEAKDAIEIGDTISGVITNITDYGCFVDIYHGVEGLLHVSQLSSEDRPAYPKELFNIGQTLEVKVLQFDDRRYQISLTVASANTADVSSSWIGDIGLSPNLGKTVLVERQQEVERLFRAHVSGQCVFIVGARGSGKTSLLHRFAHLLNNEDSALAILADCSSMSSRSESGELYSHLLRQIGEKMFTTDNANFHRWQQNNVEFVDQFFSELWSYFDFVSVNKETQLTILLDDLGHSPYQFIFELVQASNELDWVQLIIAVDTGTIKTSQLQKSIRKIEFIHLNGFKGDDLLEFIRRYFADTEITPTPEVIELLARSTSGAPRELLELLHTVHTYLNENVGTETTAIDIEKLRAFLVQRLAPQFHYRYDRLNNAERNMFYSILNGGTQDPDICEKLEGRGLVVKEGDKYVVASELVNEIFRMRSHLGNF